jgi:hypothetical protein
MWRMKVVDNFEDSSVVRCVTLRLLYGGETLSIEQVRATGLSSDDVASILGGNISKLLEI